MSSKEFCLRCLDKVRSGIQEQAARAGKTDRLCLACRMEVVAQTRSGKIREKTVCEK